MCLADTAKSWRLDLGENRQDPCPQGASSLAKKTGIQIINVLSIDRSVMSQPNGLDTKSIEASANGKTEAQKRETCPGPLTPWVARASTGTQTSPTPKSTSFLNNAQRWLCVPSFWTKTSGWAELRRCTDTEGVIFQSLQFGKDVISGIQRRGFENSQCLLPPEGCWVILGGWMWVYGRTCASMPSSVKV